MIRSFLVILLLLVTPSSALAATVRADTAITITEPTEGNAYLAASDIRVLEAVTGDLVVAGGTIDASAPISGDALIAGGTIGISAPIAGDVRIAGGRVFLGAPIEGELAAFAGHLTVASSSKEIWAAGGVVEVQGGAKGPVTIYAGTARLAGVFEGDVKVVASENVILAEGTVIKGVLEYNAPQEALIPASATVEGGIQYIGSASFLPTAEEAQTFALAGIGIFFLVRMVSAMLAAGLVVGLFPEFSRRLVEEALGRSARRFLMRALLGFAFVVAVPVLVILLLASFVGVGIAALLGAFYLLAIMLAYLFAGLLAGSMFSQAVLKRPGISWRSAAFGMLLLYLIGLIPVFGFVVSALLAAASLGAMIALMYRFCFGRAGIED